MLSFRRFLPVVMALALAAGVPLQAWTASADSPCAAAAASTDDSGCCSGGSESSHCSSACPVGGAAAVTERDRAPVALSATPPLVGPSKRLAAHTRAPDTAPPNYSVS